MPKKTLALIVGLIIVTVILFIIALRTGREQTKLMQPKPTTQITPTPITFATLMLSPNPVEVVSGKQGSVDILIDTSTKDISAVQLELIYDPLVLTNVKVTPTKFFPNPLVLINKNDVKTGQMTYAFGLQLNQDPVGGQGSVATITFTARGTAGSQSHLTLLPNTLVTTLGIENSVLKSSSGTVINIVAATNP